MNKEFNKKIYHQVQEAYKKIGCKNDSQFSKYAMEHRVSISKSSLTQWSIGGSINIDTLCKIADLCDCDLDYLLDRQSCNHKEVSSVHDETGLTEEACEVLMCLNQPYYFSKEAKQNNRERELEWYSFARSWFINRGLLDLLVDIDCYRVESKPENNAFSLFPNEIQELLKKDFQHTKGESFVDERMDAYLALVAYDLMGWGIEKVKDYIVDSDIRFMFFTQRGYPQPITCEIDGVTYYSSMNRVIDYDCWFEDFDEQRADELGLSLNDKKIITVATTLLCEKAFYYLLHEENRQPIVEEALGKFRNLINEYIDEVQK